MTEESEKLVNEKLDAVVKLFTPPLDDVVAAFQSSLSKQYSNVTAEVVECPNLTLQPFLLAGPGLGGNPKVVDVGGVRNLYPEPRKDKIYDLEKIATICQSPAAFIIGPGAGPFSDLGTNCEMMANIFLGNAGHLVSTHLAWIDKKTDEPKSGPWTKSAQFALMGNFLMTDGKPGTPVVRVRATHRTGEDDFVTCLRKGLIEKFGDKPDKAIGIGGVFVIRKGKANLHIMPDFPDKPFESEEEMNNKWLRYFDMDAPLVCLSVFYSTDPVRFDHC